MLHRLVIFLVLRSAVASGHCAFTPTILVVVKLVNVVFIGYRGLGPWGPKLVNGYAVRRFGNSEQRDPLSDVETKLLSGKLYHEFNLGILY